MPGGTGCFRIVRKWVGYACRDLEDTPSEPVGCSKFMIACTLAFDLDREKAWSFVQCAPMYKSTQWPQSASREAGTLVQDFVEFLTAEDRRSLTFGLSYLRCARQVTWVRVHQF
jgi:hypothetical protein